MSNSGYDAQAFYAALDTQRTAKGKSWKQVAHEAGVSASTLTRMGQGKRPDLDTLGALATWSGLTVDDFVVGKLAKIETEPLTRMTALLRTDRNLTSEGAATLEAILKTAYAHLRKTPE